MTICYFTQNSKMLPFIVLYSSYDILGFGMQFPIYFTLQTITTKQRD